MFGCAAPPRGVTIRWDVVERSDRTCAGETRRRHRASPSRLAQRRVAFDDCPHRLRACAARRSQRPTASLDRDGCRLRRSAGRARGHVMAFSPSRLACRRPRSFGRGRRRGASAPPPRRRDRSASGPCRPAGRASKAARGPRPRLAAAPRARADTRAAKPDLWRHARPVAPTLRMGGRCGHRSRRGSDRRQRRAHPRRSSYRERAHNGP